MRRRHILRAQLIPVGFILARKHVHIAIYVLFSNVCFQVRN